MTSRKGTKNRDSQEADTERAPVTALPDRTPKLTIERAFAGRLSDPLVRAFLAEEKHRGEGVRRQTREQWVADYETFLSAPRS